MWEGVGSNALNAGGRLLHSIKTRCSQVVAAVCCCSRCCCCCLFAVSVIKVQATLEYNVVVVVVV